MAPGRKPTCNSAQTARQKRELREPDLRRPAWRSVPAKPSHAIRDLNPGEIVHGVIPAGKRMPAARRGRDPQIDLDVVRAADGISQE
jgi:hypothetical protein